MLAQAKQQISYNHGRIAKPLRGGGGKGDVPIISPVTPMYQAIAAGSPLGRIQQDESANGKRRE